MEQLREKVDEMEGCFQVEEDQEGVCACVCVGGGYSRHIITLHLFHPGLDDDSSKLAEILDLFSSSSFPLKVEKLIKVGIAVNHYM